MIALGKSRLQVVTYRMIASNRVVRVMIQNAVMESNYCNVNFICLKAHRRLTLSNNLSLCRPAF